MSYSKYVFSGHESFPCKTLWLKKGYDFVVQGRDFNRPEAVVYLGVGKNMVASIRFWLKAFGKMRIGIGRTYQQHSFWRQQC